MIEISFHEPKHSMNHIEYVNLVAVSVAGKRLLDGAPGSKLHEVSYIHDGPSKSDLRYNFWPRVKRRVRRPTWSDHNFAEICENIGSSNREHGKNRPPFSETFAI